MKTETISYWTTDEVEQYHDTFLKKGWNLNNRCYLAWGQHSNLSIGKFFKSNSSAFDYKLVSNSNGEFSVDKLSKWSIETSEKYVDFVKQTKGSTWVKNFCTEELEQEIRFWFQGAIGEFFFIEIFPHDNIIMESADGGNKIQKTLSCVTPWFFTENEDYGIDFVAVDENNEVVSGQIKFWNAHGSRKIQWNGLFANMIAESQGKEIRLTDPTKQGNLIIMYLGNEMNDVSLSLKKHSQYKQLSLIGRSSINHTLNGRKSFSLIWNRKLKKLK